MTYEPSILFEDASLLILDKPAGLIVNNAETTTDETLEQWLVARGQGGVDRAGIVHRLDKDTSGVLAVAKTNDVMTNLQQQFKDRTVKKEYIAVVHGTMKDKEGTIVAPLGRNPKNRTKFAIVPGGREAETNWRVERYYQLSMTKIIEWLPDLNKNQRRYYTQQTQSYTLVRLFPKTGRTHQIRVHLAALLHPLVSDKVYTGRKLLKLDLIWCQRQFLHAEMLTLTHPVTQESIQFVSPLPVDLQAALQTLS